MAAPPRAPRPPLAATAASSRPGPARGPPRGRRPGGGPRATRPGPRRTAARPRNLGEQRDRRLGAHGASPRGRSDLLAHRRGVRTTSPSTWERPRASSGVEPVRTETPAAASAAPSRCGRPAIPVTGDRRARRPRSRPHRSSAAARQPWSSSVTTTTRSPAATACRCRSRRIPEASMIPGRSFVIEHRGRSPAPVATTICRARMRRSSVSWSTPTRPPS